VSTEGHHVLSRGPCALRSGGAPGTLRAGEDHRPWRAPISQEGRSGGDRGIWGGVASAQTAALFVRSAVQAHHDQDGGAPEAIVSTHFLMTARPSSYSPSAILNMALFSLRRSLVGAMRTVSVTRLPAGTRKDESCRNLSKRVARRQFQRPPLAPIPSCPTSIAPTSVSFRGNSLAGAVLHVIPDGTPMVVSRPAVHRCGARHRWPESERSARTQDRRGNAS